MPDLTVTVTNAQVTRLQNAFRFLNVTATDPIGTLASGPQIEAWMRRQLRDRVLQYEQRAAHTTADNTVNSTLAGEGWTP